MADLHLVDPQGWEHDLQSVYSAYMGYFQLHGVPWHDRKWGWFFETFEQFLAFSWPAITVTDARTGRAHIVIRKNSIVAFVKMIKTRFGETLPQADNMLVVMPFETSQRHLWHLDDWSTYKKLHLTLPTVALAALKTRVRAGDPAAIRELWATRDKTFLAIDFESLEKSGRSCIEWGYAAIRCSHLEAMGAWPPVPNTNYRKGHYIASEYADTFNKASPTVTWQYAFGESQLIPKMKLPRIIQSVLSLVNPDSETVANNVVLVGHDIQAILQCLDEMKIQLPNNVLTIDIAYFERALFVAGERGQMHERHSGRARLPESLLNLRALLRSLGFDTPCVLDNAGNDAYMTLVAFQYMIDPVGAAGVIPGGVSMSPRMGTGKGEKHVGRAATVAVRIFRPLGGTHPDLGAKRNGNGNGKEHPPQASIRSRSGGGADEVGMNVSTKRASMFSTLTSPLLLPTDKHKKRASSGSTSGSGLQFAPPVMVPGQRRYSAMEKRR